MATPLSLVLLSPERLAEAAAVMGRAAVDDPLFVYALPDAAQRAAGVPVFMQTVLRLGLYHGEVWTTPRLTGVASWFPPTHSSVTQADREAAGFDEVDAAWGEEAASRVRAVAADVGDAEAAVAAEPHWYLHWLGVEPGAQGQGIGSMLVRHITARADADGVACQLVNFAPRNVPIYEHLGFRLRSDTILPRTGLRLWVMTRPPRDQSSASATAHPRLLSSENRFDSS